MSCVITLPNGKDSLLFGSLQQLVPLTRAQELYYDYQAHSDKYKALPKDLNGEPTVEAFVKFLRLDQPVEQSVKTFSSLSPAGQIQLQLFLNQWKMFDVLPDLYRGYFGVPVSVAFGKKIINHYKGNSAIENYNAIWFKFNPMVNAIEFGNRIPPEVTLPGQGTLFNETPTLAKHVTSKSDSGILTYTGAIAALGANQVFVFGANDRGLHGRGAAGFAMYGQDKSLKFVETEAPGKVGKWTVIGKHSEITQGLLGKSYPMVTVNGNLGGKREGNRLAEEEFIRNIAKMFETAMANPDKEFLVAYSGWNPDKRSLNGYTPREMAAMFDLLPIPENVGFEENFSKLITNSIRRKLTTGEFQFETQADRETVKLDDKRLRAQQLLISAPILDAEGNEQGFFSAAQIDSINGMIKRKLLEYLVKNGAITKKSKTSILEDLTAIHKKMQERIDSNNDSLKMFGGIERAQELNNNLLMVIRSFDGLYGKVAKDLKVLYKVNFKKINQARATEAVTNDEETLDDTGTVVASESTLINDEGSAREVFSKLSEMIDPRDTMTGRVKLMLSTIKKAEYGVEEPVVEKKLPISSNELRKLIITSSSEGSPIILPRTQSQAKEIKITYSSNPKLSQGKVTLYYEDADGKRVEKDFRVTATGVMSQQEADEFNSSYLASLQKDKDGNQIVANKGDVKYSIEPFNVNESVLKDKIGWTGQPEVADMEEVFQAAIQSVHKVNPSQAEVLEALKKAGESNGTLYRLAETLESMPQHYVNEFISVIRKQNQQFKTILLKINKKKGVGITVETRTIDSNRGSAQRILVENWKENQKVSDMVTPTASGDFLVNAQLVAAFRTEMNALRAEYLAAGISKEEVLQPLMDKAKAFVNKVLNANGIMLSSEMINDLVVNVGELTKNKERLTGSTIFDHMRYGADGKALGFLSVLLDRSGDIQNAEDEEDTQSSVSKGNFLYTDKDITSILANLYIKYSGTLSTQSFKNVNGDVVYSFGHPTFLSDEFDRLKNRDHRTAMNKIAFSSGNFLFRALDAGQNINLEYVDGFTITGKSGGTERSAMSPREQEIDFVNRVLRTDTNGDFYSLTHSDKTRTPLLTNVTRTKAFSGEGYTHAITEEFVSLFVAEYKRVVLGYKDAGTYGHKKYEQGNKLFYLTPFNKDSLKAAVTKGIITEEEYAEFYTNDGNHSDVFKSGILPESMQATVRKVVTNYMGYLTRIQQDRWNEIGFMEDGLPLVNKRMLSNMVWGRNLRPETDKRGKVLSYSAIDNQGQIVESLNVSEVNAYMTEELAAEVALNSYVMNAALMQALYGDPAQFFKGNIETTLIEYQKRLAGPIAPHRAMAIGAEEKFKSVTIEDLEVGLEGVMHPAYKSKINIADAQEWVTMREWLYTNAQEGQITQEEYNDAIKIIESSPDGNYTFDSKLEGKIFGISKPVYYGNSAPVNGNVMFKTYIKSSAIPLYPPMTVGFELDKLRTWMEKNDVRRAHMISAKKAGPGEAAEVFKADGTVDVSKIQGKAIQTLDRRNLGIQQDNPYNADKKAIATVSQENKLIVATIDDNSDYNFLSGEVRNARGVREFKEKVRIEMISRKMAELNEELSIDDKGRITNPKKAYNVLKALAEDNGIAPDELLLMETDPSGNPFIHPFFLPSSRKYESLILSAVKKTLQVKITGKSYVQASAAGITKISEQGNLDISKVVWAKDVKTLKFMEKTADGVTPAQVLVPFNFFSGNKKLNIEDYMTGGKIDSSKLPPEVLQMIGARIPNQGHNSMLAIEIVGFLPPEMGDMMIVPNGITKQMGSDFDVDKLFVYQRPYNVTEEGISAGKVTETKDVSAYTDKELEHEYFDIHWAVLTNPNMYDKVLNPLDKPDITEESALFGKISRAPFLSSVRQLSDYQMQVDAKALVGLSSLATTFNAVIQNKNLRAGALVADESGAPKQVDMPITVHGVDGKPIRLVKLSGNANSYYKGQSRTKHDNITSMQSIFLDNAKDPHSGKLNLNLQTWPAAYAMVQLQTDNKADDNGIMAENTALNLRYVTRLLSSSVIREYATRLVTSKDNLSDYNAAADDQVIENIDAELVRRLSPELQSTLTDSLEQVIFNEASLEEMNGIPMNTTKPSEVLKLLAMLRKFNEFRIVGRKLIELNSLFNQDTNGAGASIVTALDKKAKYNKIMQQDVVLNTQDLMYNKDGSYTEQGFLYTKVIEDYMDSLELLFPHSTLTHLFNDIRQMAGKDKLSIRQQEEILRSMKAYVFSSSDMGIYPDGIRAERVRLMYDTAEGPSLAKRVMQALQTSWGKENSFLQRLYTKVNLADPSTVTYRATTQNKIEEIADKAAWTDLLTSDVKEARLTGEDLIRYTYIMGGVQDNNSFSKMIPTSFIQSTNISTYLNSMHGTKGTLAGKLNIEAFTTQYFQHYPENTVGLTKELAELGGNVPSTVFTIPSEINSKTTHLFVNTPEGVMPAPFINHMDENGNYRLYKLVEQNERETRYQQIDILGNKDVYEFDKGVGSIAKTVISRNMSPVAPPVTVIKPTRTVLDLEDGPQLVKPELVAIGIKKPELSFAETMDVLNNMKTNANLVKSQQLVSEILHDIMMSDSVLELAEAEAPFLKLRPSTLNKTSIGGFTTSFSKSSGKYDIGMYLDPNQTSSSYVYAETFLHEMVHMQTRLVTLAFTDPLHKRLADKLVDINPNIKQDVSRLADLFVEVNNLILDNPLLLEGFNEVDVFDINYSLKNMDEFITGVLTNKAFSRLLNSITYKKTNKSVLQQFLDLIQKLILDLGNAITDGKFKTDSYLAESLRAIIPVAKYKSKSYDSVNNNIVEFKSPNGRVYSLILDDDRNVVNVFEIVNGVAKPVADFTDIVNEYKTPVETKAPVKATKYEIVPGVHMNKEQIEAMDTITDFLTRVDSDKGGMHEIALSGAAGTGKTTILKKILAEYKGTRRIKYLAPSHNARIELNAALGKNIAMTLQKAVRMVKDVQESDRQGKQVFKVNNFARKQIGYGDIIVLDESSMVNDELIELLKEEVENGAIIIYTGDYAQLKPVGQSGLALPFRGNIPMTKLVQNMRSEKQDLTRVVDLVRFMIDANTGNYEVMSDRVNSESVTFTPRMQDVYNGFVADFSARDPRDLFNSVIISYRRKTRDAINSNVRQMLFGDNLPEFVPGDLLRVDEIGIKIGNLSKDVTPVNPKDAKAVTDMILNEQIEDTITPNERMIVKEFFPELEPIVIKVPMSDSKTVALKVDMRRIKIEKKASKDINVDVDLRFIPKEVVQNFILLAKASYNKTTRKINLKGLDSTIAQQLVDNFGLESISYSEFLQLKASLEGYTFNYDYAYAATSHNVQGSSYKNVYVIEDDLEAVIGVADPADVLKSMYVGVSRAREKLVIMHESRNRNVPTISQVNREVFPAGMEANLGTEVVQLSESWNVAYSSNGQSASTAGDPRATLLAGLLNKLSGIRKKLASQITESTHEEKSARIDRKVRLQKLELDIETIKNQMELNNIPTIAMSQLDWVRKMINTPALSAKDLMTAFDIATVWSNVSEVMGTFDEQDMQGINETALSEVSGRASKLVGEMLTSTMINHMMANTKLKRVDLVNIQDEDMIANATRSLNSAKGQLAQMMGKLMTDSARMREEQTREDAFELEDLDKKMDAYAKKKGLTKEAVMAKLVRKTSRSVTLINEFSPDWYKALYSLRKHRDTTIDQATSIPALYPDRVRLVKDAYAKYWAEMKKIVHAVDIRNLVDISTGLIMTGDKYDAELAAVTAAYGSDGQAIVDQAIERFRKYLTDKEEFFLSVDTSANQKIDVIKSDNTIPDKDAQVAIVEKERNEQKAVWQGSNSPVAFLESMNGTAATRINRGDKYTVMIPDRAKNKDYYDSTYDDMLKDTELKEMYVYVKSKIQHYLSMLPYDDTKNLVPNFFPLVDNSQLRTSASFKERIKNGAQATLEELSASQTQEAYRNSTGYEFLPVNFLHAGKDIDSISTDITRVLEMFGNMSYHFRHFSNVKETYEIGETLLNQHNARVVRGIEPGESIMNLIQSVKHTKDSIMYRRPKKLQFNTGIKIFDVKANPWNTIQWAKEQKLARKHWEMLTKKVKRLEKDRDNGTLTETEYQEQRTIVDAEVTAMESKSRTVYGSQVGDKLISFQQAKSLSYNPFSAFANWSFGYISAINYGQGAKGLGDKGDYDTKSFKKAWSTVGNSISNFFKGADSSQAMKIYKLMELTGVMGDVVDTMYGETQLSTRRDGTPKWAKPYEMMRQGDYNIRASVLVAIMMYRKAKVKNLKTGLDEYVPIWEMYDAEGNFRTADYEASGWHEKDIVDRTEWNKLKNRTNKVLYTVMGNTDKNATKFFKSGIIGRLISQFRLSWMPEGFASRWMDERYDQDLERNTKGRWREYKDIGIEGSVTVFKRMFFKMLGSNVDVFEGIEMKDGSDLQAHNMENMYRNFSGMAWTAGILLAGLMLRYIELEDDEDGEKKNVLKVLINTLYRLQQDLMFYSSTDTISTITGNAVPALRVVTDFHKAVQATWKAIEDDEYDWDQAALKGTKAGFPIPQASLINKVKFMAEKDLSTISR